MRWVHAPIVSLTYGSHIQDGRMCPSHPRFFLDIEAEVQTRPISKDIQKNP